MTEGIADDRDRGFLARSSASASTSTSTSSSPSPSARGAAPVAREALEHLDSLHHFARYLTGSAVEAEDLVQDTYARALGAEASFIPGTNLRAWLFRILQNLFIDGVRRLGRSPVSAADHEDDEEHKADLNAYAAATAVGGLSYEPLRGDAEMEALRGVVAEDIERALASLSPTARAVILLDLDGFTETEVAEILGCAIGTVKSRLGRARETLRHLLAKYRK